MTDRNKYEHEPLLCMKLEDRASCINLVSCFAVVRGHPKLFSDRGDATYARSGKVAVAADTPLSRCCPTRSSSPGSDQMTSSRVVARTEWPELLSVLLGSLGGIARDAKRLVSHRTRRTDDCEIYRVTNECYQKTRDKLHRSTLNKSEKIESIH